MLPTSFGQWYPTEERNAYFDPQPVQNLGLFHKSPPYPTNPRSNQECRTRKDHTSSKRPQGVKPSVVQNSTSNRSTNEDPKRNECKALAQPCTNLVSRIFTEIDDDGRRQANEGAGKEAVECHQHDYAGG